MHIAAIRDCDSDILGNIDLDPTRHTMRETFQAGQIYRGYEHLRSASVDDAKQMYRRSTWGRQVIQIYANRHLVD